MAENDQFIIFYPKLQESAEHFFLTDELHFLLLCVQRPAVLIPSQIVQIKYYTWAIIKLVLVVTVNVYVAHLRLQNWRFAVSIPLITLYFFFNSSFDQQTRKSYFLSFWCWHWFIQLLEIIIFWMYILPWFLLSFTVWQNMLTWMGPTWIQSNF